MTVTSLFEEYATSPTESCVDECQKRRGVRRQRAEVTQHTSRSIHTADLPTPSHDVMVTPHHSLPFYATDLTCLVLPEVEADEDVIQSGKAYRRLSPAYYVWMRKQMEAARERHERGLLPTSHYEPLKARFNAMHDVAMEQFGEAVLLAAHDTTNLATYEPPILRVSRDLSVLLQDAEMSESQPAQTVPPPDARAGQSVAGTESQLGPRVGDRAGRWAGWIIRQYPEDEWFPHGWAEIRLDGGQLAQADLRALVDANGTPLVASPRYTAYEQRAIALARDEKPEDFDDLEASLPILSFSVPGDWRFEEHPSFEDFLKVNDIRERAHALGWSDADLFQTSGRFQFPCGQEYGLVCFLRGRTPGEITADGIALLPDKPGGAVLTFHRPHRSVNEEASHGPIRETVLQRSAYPAEAVA